MISYEDTNCSHDFFLSDGFVVQVDTRQARFFARAAFSARGLFALESRRLTNISELIDEPGTNNYISGQEEGFVPALGF